MGTTYNNSSIGERWSQEGFQSSNAENERRPFTVPPSSSPWSPHPNLPRVRPGWNLWLNLHSGEIEARSQPQRLPGADLRVRRRSNEQYVAATSEMESMNESSVILPSKFFDGYRNVSNALLARLRLEHPFFVQIF